MASLRAGHANRLYAAEQVAFDYRVQDLGSKDAVQLFTDVVVRSSCFRRMWAANRGQLFADPVRSCPKHVKVRHFTGSGAYHYYGSSEIRVGSRRQSRYVVLHELAHLLAPADEHGHGRAFARIYLTLVRRFMPQHADGLLVAYRAHGVRYRKSPPKDA